MIKRDDFDLMLENLRLGLNPTDACELAQISTVTYYRWLKDDKEKAAEILRAKVECKKRCLSIIQKAGVRSWQAAAWHLERKYPEEYSLKSRVEHSGNLEIKTVVIS